MKTSSPLFVAVAALVMVGTGWATLLRVKNRQHLGVPGVRMTAIPTLSRTGGIVRSNSIPLPRGVPGHSATVGEIDETEWQSLPPDTTFGRMIYSRGSREYPVQASVILMGADRTSIHQPEFCLKGNGWNIQSRSTRWVPFDRINGGGLDVRRFDALTNVRGEDGAIHPLAGVYVFWFVADGQWTASHWTRTLWMTRDLLTRNVLQRWAYVSYFATCQPGDEEKAYEHVCELIRVTVPQFQIAGIQPR
jgi:hypothetical protein